MIDRLCQCSSLSQHSFHIRIFFRIVESLVVFLIICKTLVSSVDVSFNKDNCDPDEYYEPYIKVTKSRKGSVITGIYETGFIHLSNYSGLLCINGPAFLYSDKTGDIYLKAEAQVFAHGCIIFNRRDSKAYKGAKLKAMDSDTKVYGPKIFGAFLIAEGNDYRRSQFKWFHHPNFGTKENVSDTDVINGSSFGMVVNDGGKSGAEEFESPPGPTAYCFQVESAKIDGKIKGEIKPGEDPKFCYREEEDESGEFDEVFHKKFAASLYKWPKCNDSDSNGSPDVDDSTPKPMPDFRIIDPALLNAKGSAGKIFKPKPVNKPADSIPFYSRPFPPGYYFKGEPGYVGPVTESPADESNNNDGGSSSTTIAPTKSVKADARDCEEISKVPDCSEDPDGDKACELLKRVLTIEEINWKSDKLMPASWRKDILSLIIKIYQHVCPQVSKGLAPAVTRIVEYFIEKVSNDSNTAKGDPPKKPGEIKFKILNDPKRENWDNHLIPDLERCLKSAEKMPFYRTRDQVNEKKKKELEKEIESLARKDNNSNKTSKTQQQLDDKLKDNHIVFPYFIWLPPPKSWNNKTQIQVKEHLEAAEIDYNLDWAIDTFWKVFSTVLGYCNQHYVIREGATFKMLYSLFTEDFLDLVTEQWLQESHDPDGNSYIFGNFEKVYDQLFGEFVNGVASRYIDACNDGAYWWADVPDFRPQRPVYLKVGATSAGSERPLNFFIEHPLFKGYDPLDFLDTKQTA